MKRLRGYAVWICAALALTACGPRDGGTVDPVEAFYRGKTISIVVGATSGGEYDLSARAVARFLGKHIPGNPRVIVQNMPGGGGLIAANYVFHVAPKDGTVMGIFTDATLLAPLWGFEGARFDSREVNWLGSIATRNATVVWVRSDAPATTLEEIKKTEVTVGSSGPNSSTTTYALLMNELLGTKFKVILGYPGNTEVMLALERGEIHGRVAGDWNSVKTYHPEWIEKKTMTLIAQLTMEPIPGLDHVPRVITMARNQEDKMVMDVVLGNQELHNIFAAAPGLLSERLEALRTGMRKMMKDPDFLADAGKTTALSLEFSDHAEIDAFLRKAYALPEKTRARAARYLGGS